ncbi:MAG TPA: helix-turn-helix domain-containing protein [Myxococcales bacterium]
MFGEHLREARLRRNMTVEQMAKAVGLTRKTISEAEKGSASTRVGAYVGMLWALGLGDQLAELAAAERDDEEFAGDGGRKRARPRFL